MAILANKKTYGPQKMGGQKWMMLTRTRRHSNLIQSITQLFSLHIVILIPNSVIVMLSSSISRSNFVMRTAKSRLILLTTKKILGFSLCSSIQVELRP